MCTLTSEDLTTAVVQEAEPEIAIVGTLHTENLGIERLIHNILANPNLRFVIVCVMIPSRPSGTILGNR